MSLSPVVEELLEGFATAPPEAMGRRERAVEAVSAAAFLGVALAMAFSLDVGAAPSLATLAPLVAAYALLSRVRFHIGYGFTVPTQLAFVPMLLLVPPGLVPLLVALAILLGNLPDYLRRKTHPERGLIGLGDSWHAVGPALVIALSGAQDPAISHWPVYVGALAAQFLFDAVASSVRECLGLGISPRVQPPVLGWVFLVDLLLSPVALLAALAAEDRPVEALLVLPLAALLALFARDRRARIEHALELSRAYRGTTLLLSDVIESDDEYTGVHSRSVVSLAVAVSDELGLDARDRRNVEFGALLHDVGKIAVPKAIINKDGPLDEDEWAVIKTHTVEGQRMLDQVGGVLSDVGTIVRSSHEWWDGSGYPDGLEGERIPLPSAIVSCADAFNAITTDRSYRAARPTAEALTELRRASGTQFRPDVVEALCRIVERSAPGAPEAAHDHPAVSALSA